MPPAAELALLGVIAETTADKAQVTGQVDWGAGSQGWPSASWVSAW